MAHSARPASGGARVGVYCSGVPVLADWIVHVASRLAHSAELLHSGDGAPLWAGCVRVVCRCAPNVYGPTGWDVGAVADDAVEPARNALGTNSCIGRTVQECEARSLRIDVVDGVG